MQKLTIIDADSIFHKAAWIKDEEGKYVHITESYKCADQFMTNILLSTEADYFVLLCGGKRSFRHLLNPNYKSSRTDKILPPNLYTIAETTASKWLGLRCNGFEADDAVASYAHRYKNQYDITIARIDKDLAQIPGKHYIFDKQVFVEVDKRDAAINFYTQLITGDKADDIDGLTVRTEQLKEVYGLDNRKGVGPTTANKIISKIIEDGDSPHKKIQEMYEWEYGPIAGPKIFIETYIMLKLLPHISASSLENYRITPAKTLLNKNII